MNTTFYPYQNLPFHRKNGKRDNIYYQVIRRPTNGTSLRRDLKIIRSLVQREGSSFLEVWRKNTKNPVGFDSQHLFFDRFRTCYTSYGFEGKPELLYQENSRKIESALVFESPVDQTSFLDCSESRGYKPCLLAVTKDGWLVRHDLKTGDLLESKKAWHCFFSRLTTGYEQRRRALITWVNHPIEFRSSPSFFDSTLTVKNKNKKLTRKLVSI